MINNLLKTISEAEIFQLVLFFILLTLVFIQVLFKIIFLIRISLLKQDTRGKTRTPVSIIMTERNEEENLSENLPGLLAFNNENYEVIVVDDFSQDNSLSVLGKLREANSNLKVSALNQETRFSIKLSQNIGLKSMKNDWALVVPPSVNQYKNEWVVNICSTIPPGAETIINYCNVTRNKKLFNKLFRIETFLLYLKSMAYSMAGFPFVFFENNVVFRKQKYFELGGYGKKIKEPYANLELLINQFLSKKKCRFVLNDDTAIRFTEKVSRHDFLDLIRKSFCIEQHLSFSKRLVLFLSSFVKLIILPLLVVVILLFTGVWPIVLVAVCILLILHLFIIKTMQNRLNERKIFITSLMYDLVVPYFKIVFRWHFNRKRHKQNGRTKFKVI